MPTSATKEFEESSLGEGSNGVVGKTNNEKNQLDMVLWNTSQNYEVTTCHSWEEELDWYEQGDEKVFHREDKEELASFMSIINSTILREELLGEI